MLICLALQKLKNYSIKKAFQLISDYLIQTFHNYRRIGRLMVRVLILKVVDRGFHTSRVNPLTLTLKFVGFR